MKKLLTLVSLVSILTFNNSALADGDSSSTEQAEPSENVILYVDINSDSAEKMADLLSGVGIKKAEAIVLYRNTVGKFESIDDFINVPGIGPSTLEKNRERIQLSLLTE